jgi:hypothetical protein
MNYTPGTIVSVIGIVYLVSALFTQQPQERASRIKNGLINIGIGVVLFVVFGIVLNKN